MSLRTRLFGKKVEEEALRKLVEAMGKDPRHLLDDVGYRWSLDGVHGRVSLSPSLEGIGVDLYVFKKIFHRCDESLSRDTWRMSKVIYDTDVQHLKGEIKY